MRASAESGGSALLQFSHVGLSSSMQAASLHSRRALSRSLDELAAVLAAALGVVRCARFETAALRVRELAHAPRRRADDQRAVREHLALGDQRSCADQAVLADDGVAEDRRADADQREVADGAAVHRGSMADRDAAADRARRVGVDVNDRRVLHVRVVADANVVDVASEHGTEPDIGMAAQEHAADHGSARRDVELVAAGLHAMCSEVVEHGYFFLALAWLATASAAAAIAAASPRYSARVGLRSASSSYRRGIPVGMLSSVISSSEMFSSIFTTARKLLPCAATRTLRPRLSSAAMRSSQ